MSHEQYVLLRMYNIKIIYNTLLVSIYISNIIYIGNMMCKEHLKKDQGSVQPWAGGKKPLIRLSLC